VAAYSSFQICAHVIEVDGRKRLRFEDEDVYRMHVESYEPGQCLCVTIEEEKEHRSKTLKQLGYWWGHAVPEIAKHCGYTDSQMHYALLGECFGYTEGPCGKPLPVLPGLTDATVEQVAQLIDWVLVWAPSELGVVLQDPDKNWKAKRQHARRRKVSADVERRQTCPA
jgi:hypothetical protein